MRLHVPLTKKGASMERRPNGEHGPSEE